MTAPAEPLLHHIRRLIARPDEEASSDTALLQRFVQQRDEAAFAALLARHGPMVYGVCRRALRDVRDAEDVFQATFLVLARKAGSLRRPETLSAWLHGTARRLALTSRRAAARRHQREARCLEMVPPPSQTDPLDELSAREFLLVLDEEMARLPERYLLPLLLCGLQGRGQEEAARILGWTPGSLKGRLERGRKQLHARLTRRGLVCSGVVLALGVPRGGSASAAARLTSATLEAALAFARGERGGIAATVLTLAETGIASVTMTKAKVGLVLLMMMGLAAGTGVLAYPLRSEKQPEAKEAKASQPETMKRARTDRYGDPLPPGAVVRLGTRRLCGPDDSMWLRFSPDGSKIASQGFDVLTVWDAASGKRLVHRMKYDPLVNGMAWRKDGTGVAVVRLPDRSYFVSEFTNAREKLPNPPPVPLPNVIANPGPDGIDSVALSPDGTRLALVRNPDKEKITIDLLTVVIGRLVGKLQRERTLGPFKGPCEEVRYSAAGQLVILSSPPKKKGDWSLTVVDPNRNCVLRTARIPPPGFCPWKYMLNLSADARLAAIPPRQGGPDSVNAHDGTLRVWDLDAGKQLWSLPFPQRSYGVGHAFTPDGKRLITSTDKEFFRIWDLASGKEVGRLLEQTSTFSDRLAAAAFSPDGKGFATARRDGNIDIWDTQTVKPIITFATHRVRIKSVTVSPDSRLTATLGDDGFIRTWELATGRPIGAIAAPSVAKLPQPDWFKPRVPFTPDGRGLLFRVSGGLALADPNTGKRLELPAALRNRQEYIGGFSADGRTLATFCEEKVTLWDWPAASIRVTFSVPLNPQKPARIKKGPERVEVNSVALSADGQLAFTNSTRRQDNPQGFGHHNSNDVWDGHTGKHRHRLTALETEYSPGVFAPDGRVLYLGGHSLNVRERRTTDALTVWDPATGRLLGRFAEPQRGAKSPLEERHGRMVSSLAVSPDGRLLAAAEDPLTSNDNIRLYETASGRVLKELAGHVRQVTDLTFTPDGRRLVSVSEDHTGLVWDVTVPALGDAAAKQLAHAWERLAEFDPKPAYNAMAALTANPTEAIALLREKLRPAPIPTDADLDRLIGQLDADAFADRQKALAELERFGPNAVAGVKVRLKQSPPLEVRKQLLLFLEQYDGPNPHQLRCSRAVAILEAMNTAETRDLLAKLAKGPPNDVLTREAQAASRRAAR